MPCEVDAIIEQYLMRLEAGERVDERQLLEQYPEVADELAGFFELHRRACSAFLGPSPERDPNIGRDQPMDPDQTVDLVAPTARPAERIGGSRQRWSAGPLPRDQETRGAGDPTRTPESVWSWNRVEVAQFPLPFGPYDLVEEINRGGMGIVYKAVHRGLKRVVALKVMRAGDLATDEELHRFRTEAVASSSLSHPNIIPIFEAGEEHGLFYFTMAYIEGEDLESRLRSGPVDAAQSAKILLKTTEAVAYAHRKNVIHRDIKPSNVLLDRDGEPFLADFGLARLHATDDRLTVTGQVLGTPAYMAPEQATGRGNQMTAAVDVYALGAVLYTLLTRQPPFSGPTAFDILLQLFDRQPPAPSQLNKQAPRALEAICLTAMAKNPQDRYTSADAMAADLRRYLRGEPIMIRRPSIRQKIELWWRREPVLVSHLVAFLVVGVIITASFAVRSSSVPLMIFAVKFGMLVTWAVASVLLQRLARRRPRWSDWVYLAWAATDVTIYTSLILLADAPRGLLLVGYPMMIAASGLFYRVRFVVFMTTVCCCGMLLVANVVEDPLAERMDFLGIYISGLVVLGACVVTMIRRVRGLSRFYGESE